MPDPAGNKFAPSYSTRGSITQRPLKPLAEALFTQTLYLKSNIIENSTISSLSASWYMTRPDRSQQRCSQDACGWLFLLICLDSELLSWWKTHPFPGMHIIGVLLFTVLDVQYESVCGLIPNLLYFPFCDKKRRVLAKALCLLISYSRQQVMSTNTIMY